MQNDLVPGLYVRDAGAGGVYPACVFMADGVWQRDVGLFGPLAFEDVQVCSADASGADFDDYVEGPFYLRLRDVGGFEVFVVADYADGFHLEWVGTRD